jgi:F-type H+-transporting ATPase subunit gamma
MPSLKAIRRRIATVKNTQKITKAMKMVAAARLRRAQQAIMALRPYAKKTADVLASVASRAGDGEAEAPHPLLEVRKEVKRVAIVTLTSDRGLAGAFNANIQRAVDRKLREFADAGGGVEVQLVTIGRKGRDYFRRRGVPILHDFTGAYEGGATRAAEIARQLIDDFSPKKDKEEGTEPKVDLVLIAYNEFKSAISQRVVIEQVLPIRPEAPDASAPAAGAPVATEAGAGGAAAGAGDFIFEPNRAALLDRLLPMYVEVAVLRAMLESVASEHGARMAAMDNATNNAKKMIGSLTLVYNRARQAAITKELMEIIGGAEALKD